MARASHVVNLTDDDYKGATFKVAPAGKYTVSITNKSKVGKAGSGGAKLVVHGKISKGEHKGVTFFDHIAASVGWKVAQLLMALGIKKKKITLEEILKLAVGKELRAVLKVDKWEGKKNNKVVQWLPLTASEDEDDDEELDEDDEDTGDDDEDVGDDDDTDEDDDTDSDDDEDEDAGDDDDDEDEDAGDDDENDEDEDEDEDSDDDEEEEKPAPRKRAVKKAAAKKGAAKKTAAKKTGKRK
jgi:hypothetical protein